MLENEQKGTVDGKHTYHNPVFYVSAAVVALLVLAGAIFTDAFKETANTLFSFTTINFGWFYLWRYLFYYLSSSAFRYQIWEASAWSQRLPPGISIFYLDWDAFSAGFGAGLVFWGVAEPMSHFFETPFAGLEAQTEEAARVAMGYAFFHWGISQWSVFAVVGLIIAFLQFKKDKKGLISTAIKPVVGNNRALSGTIDSLAVIATVMGVATSLGLGILQLNGGLKSVFHVPTSVWVQVGIATVMLVTYLLSSSTGLNKGIKWLSNLNLGLCLVLLVLCLLQDRLYLY